MSVEITGELSAIASRPCPRSIRQLAPQLATEANRVADIGCGYLAGTAELLRHHKRVYAVDTVVQRQRIADRLRPLEAATGFAGFRSSGEFQASKLRLGGAYLINVLHTVPSVAERVSLLRSSHQNLCSGGFAVVDVPSYEHYYSQRMQTDNAFGDGYIFCHPGNRYTFYRFCAAEELDDWASAANLEFERAVSDHHHQVRIYRKA
jgi:SAM-dependent methyltransferase